MYKVSVIIPAYNAAKTIGRSIKSILDQDLTDLEIIVVNDGSTDQTLEVLQQYEGNHVVIVNKANGGVSTARNAGLHVARGEYVAFLDSDDYYDANAISVMYDWAKVHQLDIVSCGHVEANATVYGGNDSSFADFVAVTPEGIGQHYLDLFPKSVCAKLFRAQILRKQEIAFDEGMHLGEDLCFSWSVLPYVSQVGGVGSVYYHVDNVNPDSLSKKYVPALGRDLLTQLHKWEQIIDLYPEAGNIYYQKNMDYGLSVVAAFANNLFRRGCPLGIWQKCRQIREYLNAHRELYDNAKAPERKPKSRFDKIQYLVLMTRSASILCLFFWLKEKIKRYKFNKGIRGST